MLDRIDRLSIATVKNKNLATFCQLDDNRYNGTIGSWEVIKNRLGRNVIVELVDIGSSEMPGFLTCFYVYRDDRVVIFIRIRVAIACPEVRCLVTCREIDKVKLRIIRGSAPEIRCFRRIGLTCGKRSAVFCTACCIPCPENFTGNGVKSTDNTGRFANCQVIVQPSTNDNHAIGNKRSRRDIVRALITCRGLFCKTNSQVNKTVVTKAVTKLAGFRVKCEETCVNCGYNNTFTANRRKGSLSIAAVFVITVCYRMIGSSLFILFSEIGVTNATASLPAFCTLENFWLRIVFPFFTARCRIKCNNLVERRAKVNCIIHFQWRDLIFCSVNCKVACMISPGNFQILDVGFIDLIELCITIAFGVAPPCRPIISAVLAGIAIDNR